MLLVATLAFASTSAFAQFVDVQSSCNNNEFRLSANLEASAVCTVNDKINVNGVERFETTVFNGAFTRTIPLQSGDQASVTSTFQCSLPNGSFSGSRTGRTVDGCDAVAVENPPVLPEPTPIEPEEPELDPAALQEFQLELGQILTFAQGEADRVEVRAVRFLNRSPRFATLILESGIRRINVLTEARVDRAVTIFADRVKTEELLTALEQFEDEFALVIDITL